MEHVLILVIAVFLLYHLMNRCSNVMRSGNGFSVGGKILSNFDNCNTDGKFLQETFKCSELKKQDRIINFNKYQAKIDAETINTKNNRIDELTNENIDLISQIDNKCDPDGICNIDPCPSPSKPTMCDPNAVPKQLCPNGKACQDCGLTSCPCLENEEIFN